MAIGKRTRDKEETGVRASIRAFVDGVLTDHFMMVLALILIPTTVFPLIPKFKFTPFMLSLFWYVNLGILIAFTVEYVLKLYLAESKREFVLDVWHILDLFIILMATLDFLPFIPLQGGRYSPLLRLLRIARVFVIAGRAAKRAKTRNHEAAVEAPPKEMVINVLQEGGTLRACSREDLIERLSNGTPTWVDVQNVSKTDFEFLGKALTIPAFVLESKSVQESFPRIEQFKDQTLVFLWDSKITVDNEQIRDIQISKHGILIVCSDKFVATICTRGNGLFGQIDGTGLLLPEQPFMVRALYSILKTKAHDYEEIVRVLERETVDLEDVPVHAKPRHFLEETFQLKKEIQRIHYNLWHFRQVLDAVRERKVLLRGIPEESLDLLNLLSGEAEDLFETLQNVREGLISLIELHLNTVSFDMNKVMKMLAVFTCLSLIPTIIGGLLGENLRDQPWNITLSEVFFIVLSLMLLGLYAFYRKGWLR